MSASNNSFVLVTIITVFNVIQEVIDSLIFVYMSFTSSSSVISKTLERNELHVVGIQVWRQSSFVHSMYSWSQQMRRALCPSKSWKHILGQTTCMTDEYTFKRLPISLQCIPPLNMSISRSQYILFRNSGIVNTGILELSLCIYMGVRHTV